MKEKMVISHAAGDDLFHVLRETNRQSDFSILFFLSLNIMSFIHFLLQVRTIKCDLDSIFEHDSYRPQTKFVKVMFLHLSVSHSVHGGGGVVCLVPVGCLVPEGVCSGGVPAPGEGGSAPGGCLVLGGVPGGDPLGTATAAGGTHPTGMHSCLQYFCTRLHFFPHFGLFAKNCTFLS